MSDNFRYRYGETSPVMVAVESATVIEIGDLVWLDGSNAKPASDQADAGSESLNQQEFHANFLGVAMQRSPVGETKLIRVATSGVFEFVTPSGTYDLGELIGADEAASGTELENQQVDAVGDAGQAIGRCVRAVAVADTKLLMAIQSTIIWGGPQVAL